ncbi:MAG: hypothetical protein RMJ89_12710, partial [Flammeovirgaceae bacterium]|nr:hypothetical protein [Flammeovirgaceae bacterium]
MRKLRCSATGQSNIVVFLLPYRILRKVFNIQPLALFFHCYLSFRSRFACCIGFSVPSPAPRAVS